MFQGILWHHRLDIPSSSRRLPIKVYGRPRAILRHSTCPEADRPLLLAPSRVWELPWPRIHRAKRAISKSQGSRKAIFGRIRDRDNGSFKVNFYSNNSSNNSSLILNRIHIFLSYQSMRENLSMR